MTGAQDKRNCCINHHRFAKITLKGAHHVKQTAILTPSPSIRRYLVCSADVSAVSVALPGCG